MGANDQSLCSGLPDKILPGKNKIIRRVDLPSEWTVQVGKDLKSDNKSRHQGQ